MEIRISTLYNLDYKINDYIFVGLVRKCEDGKYRLNTCADPAHEPWALIVHRGTTISTLEAFVTDGIEIIEVDTIVERGLTPIKSTPSKSEREAILQAFAKGLDL